MNKLNSIKKACRITDQIYSKLIKNLKNFNSELDIKHFILKEIKQRKLKPAFPPIVATGKNASLPHHKPGKQLNQGFCVLDFGIRINGYCSDMTRTIFIGAPTKQQKALYKLVLNAQTKTIKQVKPGVDCYNLAKYADQLLGKHKAKMIHSLGHGLGKHIHIHPVISDRFHHILKETDIITIEPGIYHKNRYGIRIEDTVTAKGKVLTKSKKKLYLFNQYSHNTRTAATASLG